jgi:hypothetical protein
MNGSMHKYGLDCDNTDDEMHQHRNVHMNKRDINNSRFLADTIQNCINHIE